ncbi:uncharacterized protein LOC143452682 [Clavelina lepadiformis]|uniref:uncharacterized protein LOC143452682 n=1 Tax=Clavelina lepadiformis TaxID=159417 RepID=UPI004042CE9B
MNGGLLLTKSTRGKPKLTLESGESFVHDKDSSDEVWTLWRCSRRGHCRARLRLKKEDFAKLDSRLPIESSSWEKYGESDCLKNVCRTTSHDTAHAKPSNEECVPPSGQHSCSSNQLAAVSNLVHEEASACGTTRSHQLTRSNQQRLVTDGNVSAGVQLHETESVQEDTINQPRVSDVAMSSSTSTTPSLPQPPAAKRVCYGANNNTTGRNQSDNSSDRVSTNNNPHQLCLEQNHIVDTTEDASSAASNDLSSSSSSEVSSAWRNSLRVAGTEGRQLNSSDMKKILDNVQFLRSKITGVADDLSDSDNAYCEVSCQSTDDVVDLFYLLKRRESDFKIKVELYHKEEIEVKLDAVPLRFEVSRVQSYLHRNHGTVLPPGITRMRDEVGFHTGSCTLLMRRRDLDKKPIPQQIDVDGSKIRVSYKEQNLQEPSLPAASSAEPNAGGSFLGLLYSAEPERADGREVHGNEPKPGFQVDDNLQVTPTTMSTFNSTSENVGIAFNGPPPTVFQTTAMQTAAADPYSQPGYTRGDVLQQHSVGGVGFIQPMFEVGHIQDSASAQNAVRASEPTQPMQCDHMYNYPGVETINPTTNNRQVIGQSGGVISPSSNRNNQLQSTSQEQTDEEDDLMSLLLNPGDSPHYTGNAAMFSQAVPAGLEILKKNISSISDLVSNHKIDEALRICNDLISVMRTTFVTGDDAIKPGNKIVDLMSTLMCKKYSPTILTLLLLAGDLHKQIDGPTEKVKRMERCAFECLDFISRYNENLQRTTYRHVISRMTDFVQSIQSVKIDDEKLAATSKAHCWLTIAECHRFLDEYSRAIEVLQPAIATLESTFGDGCRKMWLYSGCCNNIGVYYYCNNQPVEAEAFYIKAFHANQEVEDVSEQSNMENIHCTINNLCRLYQHHPTMTREKGSDVYSSLQQQKHLTGLPRFWNMLSSLRLMILLNLDGDVKSICNELVTMATNISPPADQRNDLCIRLRQTAGHLFSKNDEESAMSLISCGMKLSEFE